MRKTYSKPEIAFEGFSICTNIAAGCEKILGLPSVNICGITGSAPGLTFFSVGVDGSNCNVPGTGDMSTNDGFCYHNPNTDQNIFNS